jgi:hypothetical protein
MRGREVRLADERGVITGASQAARESGLAQRFRQIDAVVRYAVRQRQQPGQYRRARRLANEVRRDCSVKPCAGPCHGVKMRRLYAPPGESEAVGPLLVRRHE